MGSIVSGGSPVGPGGLGGNYVTVLEVKDFKSGGSVSGVENSYSNEQILEEIQLMEQYVETLTGDIFYEKTETNRFDGKGLERLFFIPKIPYRLLSITSVKEYDLDGTTLLETFVENVDFKAYPFYLEMGKQFDDDSPRRNFGRGGTWPMGQLNVAVEGVWGSAETPLAIKRAVMLLVLERMVPGFTKISPSDIKQAIWPDFTVIFKGGEETVGMSTGFAEVDRLLKPYVNYSTLFLAVPDDRSKYGN